MALAAWSTKAWAMPNFARKEGVACTVCHTTIPRLTEYGFQYRKAGFRDPGEIGNSSETKLVNVLAARIQIRYDAKHRDDAGKTTNSNQLTFHEFTFYPLSGSFGKYYGSLVEMSILGEDFVEIENAYFRYSRGNDEAWFSARGGIFHPFEGYGASDRPYSLSRPFIQGVTANQNGSTFFKPWGFDQAGVEVAYVHDRTSISGTLFNGIFVADDEGNYKAFPAAGGKLTKSSGFEKTNSKDFQVFLNQILGENGSGLSFYYYHGSTDLPIPGTPPEDFSRDASFGNDFYRAALYGSYRVMPNLEFQGAFQYGQDHFFDVATESSDNTFNSKGFFGEVDVPVNENLALGGRYDWFDSSDLRGDNARRGFTAFANAPFNDGLQFIAQFQHIAQERFGKADLKDDNFQLRLIWIF